ncbi:MAG: phosphate/phosphite/phosphonate ABC transporter substrate-binding protein [Candidatus Thiodiazotropha sp. (ex Monitilora ramsayi)]|nr:phosphate/phosphite/phosphonate ABC transporter substrate-binding protein [Candidatus Thiodiazotropha sp. (ex Monitilora ramsayi)]
MENGLKNPHLLFVRFIILLFFSSTLHADGHNIVRVGGSAESIYDTNITDVEIMFSLLFNEMFKEDDEQFKIEIYNSDDTLERGLKQGELDAIFANTVHYLEIEELLNKSPSFAVQHGDSVHSKYFLIVRENDSIDKLADLQGKKIFIPSGHTVGELFLGVQLLRSNHGPLDVFFSEVRRSNKSNDAIVSLFFGQVDAALVTEFSFEVASELNPQIATSLKILSKSEPLVHMVISVHNDFPQDRVDNIYPRLGGIEELPRLDFLRKTFRFEGIHQINNEDLSNVRALSNEYRQLMSRRAIK